MRKRTLAQGSACLGRPPRELAGEVEERILNAARQVFLERGYEGASMDEIAEVARAGKPTIYARYPGKDALLVAVIAREVANRTPQGLECSAPRGATLEEHARAIGAALLETVLQPGKVGLLRLAMAEAPRFPEMAASVARMARERRIEQVASLLAEAAGAEGLDALPAFAPGQLATTARHFLDLVVLPLLIRALFGEELSSLRAEIGPHVAAAVNFFVAACREARPGQP